MVCEIRAFITSKQAEAPLDRFVPTLLIGLGGTGRDVLMRLRKRFYDEVGNIPGNYLRYLLIDVDCDQWCPSGEWAEAFTPVHPKPDEYIDCQVSETAFHTVFDLQERQHDPRFLWLRPELRNYTHHCLSHGTGTHRPFGRLALLLHEAEVRQRIHWQLEGMFANLAGLHPEDICEDRVEIVIVTSLAGGAGGGMFIDVAYMVRDILNQNPVLRALNQTHVTLVAVLPSTFQEVAGPTIFQKLEANGYAALLEMEHYGAPRRGEELFWGPLPDGCRVQDHVGLVAPWKENQFIPGQGWDACYLIDAVSPGRPGIPLSVPETFRMIADYLFAGFQGTPFGAQRRSLRANLAQFRQDMVGTWVRCPTLAQGFLQRDTDVVFATTNSAAFSSFGLSEIAFGRDRLYRAAACRLASRFIAERWLGTAARQNSECVERGENMLRRLVEHLRARFDQLSTQPRSDRSQLLLPAWGEADYDSRIDQALRTHAAVGRDGDLQARPWDHFEPWLLAQLHVLRPQQFGPSIRTLTDLLEQWYTCYPPGFSGEPDPALIADTVAAACYQFLLQSGLDLQDDYDGCIVDILASQPAPEREQRIETLIATSGPYLPIPEPSGVGPLGQYVPTQVNLLALPAGDGNQPGPDDAPRPDRERLVLEAARQENLTAWPRAAGDRDSLCLSREVWGVPLQYCACLDRLHEAYQHSHDWEALHIDCRETWVDLPDVRALAPEVFQALSDGVDTVLFSLIVGTITCQPDLSYVVSAPDPTGGVNCLLLGRRLCRVVRHACARQEVREFLESRRAEWEQAATPAQWALVYASARWTYEYLRTEVRCDSNLPSPVQNCMGEILKRCERQLRSSDEGNARLRRVQCWDNDLHQAQARLQALFAELIDRKKILFRVRETVPLHQVNWQLIDQLD